MTAAISLQHLRALSIEPAAFRGLVDAHVHALHAHRGTVGEAAPVAHPLVTMAVAHDRDEAGADRWQADYKIVDDLPPVPTLRQRKDALIGAVARAEHEAMATVLPHGKRRHYGFALQDAQRHQADALKNGTEVSTASQAVIDEAAKRADRENAIARHAAGQMAEVEDLTEADLDGWVMAPFPRAE